MSMNDDQLLGPERLYGSPMISAPDGLALEYNKALAEILYHLSDVELARLSINLNTKIKNRPSNYSPNSTDLAKTKVEAEAVNRWNNRKGGNNYLNCILRGELFLPE